MKQLISFILIYSFCCPYAVAAGGGLAFDNRVTGEEVHNMVSEFVYQKEQNEVLIPVYLLGAVNKPGLYHVPVHTDIFSLIALAGGTDKEAELSKIQIMHRNPLTNTGTNTVNMDLASAIQNPTNAVPPLMLNDVVMFPSREPTFSQNTVTTIGIVATVVGIVLTGFLVKQAFR